MPKTQRENIEKWKKLMPDYTIMRWDDSSFDYKKYPVSKYGYEANRLALVADLCRFNVLAEYGGIYLDTDVEVFKRYDDYLDCDFFSALELYPEFYSDEVQSMVGPDGNPINDVNIPKCEILTSTLACAPNHPFVEELRDWYNGQDADYEWALNFRDHANLDQLVARHAVKYGFRYKDETQYLDKGMVIYKTGIFGYPWGVTDQYIVSYHHNAMTWDQETWSSTKKKEYFFDRFGLLEPYRLLKKVKHKLIK